jgi:hypothetical protein
MIRWSWRPMLFAVTLSAAACATVQQSQSLDVPVAPGVTLRLPNQPPFGAGTTAIQLVQATYGERREVFQALIEATADRAEIVVTIPSGPRLMSIAWGPTGIASTIEPQVPAQMTAEHMLSDMVLIYAPKATLELALSGGVLTTSPSGEARKITKDGKDLILITRPPEQTANPWNGRAVIMNLAYGYRIEIRSASNDP